MKSNFLEGMTAVITGSNRGIGRQLALDFALSGAQVVVNYWQDQVGAIAVVREIVEAGGRAISVCADVSDIRAVKAMHEKTLNAFGTIDILINNAGINIDKPFLELSEEDWDRVMEVNLKGPFLCSQIMGRAMISGGSGKIINISAITGIKARVNAANYCASMAGLNMQTKCVALELAPRVQVNSIALGFFDSELVRNLYTQDQIDAVCESTPIGRMGSLNEISKLALFLSSSGSDFMTGQTIVLDGGLILSFINKT